MKRADGGAIATAGLAARTGCNIETIRYYERIGLLPSPVRSASGRRFYAPVHVRRLAFIRRARAFGFTLDEVRGLLRLADDNNRSCAEVRDMVAAHLEDVRAKLADLHRTVRLLQDSIARCPDGTRSDCPIIGMLSAEQPDRAV